MLDCEASDGRLKHPRKALGVEKEIVRHKVLVLEIQYWLEKRAR